MRDAPGLTSYPQSMNGQLLCILLAYMVIGTSSGERNMLASNDQLFVRFPLKGVDGLKDGVTYQEAVADIVGQLNSINKTV